MERPRQAVILAGGRGERLKPLTDTIPKPMIGFHGHPFLEYLLHLVKREGFQKVLLLVGYKAEKIQDFFGDGKRFGLTIDYSVLPPEADTGLRLKTAQEKIDPLFFLMYCDNYWPIGFDKMWEHYQKLGCEAMVTVYANRDATSKNNICVGFDGIVTAYDRSRTQKGLNGVELGFAILHREILDTLSQGNVHFEASAYPPLVAAGQMGAFVTEHRYYSVSSLERLPLTEKFLAFPKTIFLDRDGVLNRKAPAGGYVTNWKDFEWLPGAKESLKLLKQAGYKVIVITNQAGIARKFMTEANLHHIHENMIREASQAGGSIDAIYYCPHHWDEGCFCRKPSPGLLYQAQREHHLDLTRTPFIGDDGRDVEAGGKAGCPTFLIREGELLTCVREKILRTNAS